LPGSSRWPCSPTWLRLAAQGGHLPFPIRFTSFPVTLHAATRLTSAAFRRGYCPICPVMSSRCLSAGSLRFLRHLVPTGAFGLPYGRLTQAALRPHWGCHVPHERDTTGVGASFTAGNGCPQSRLVGPTSHAPTITVSAGYGVPMSRGLIRGSLAFTRPVFP
jgi:hypothetical protein